MGEEIDQHIFNGKDFEQFSVNLRAETALLQEWLHDGYLLDDGYSAGVEIEAWLLNAANQVCPENEAFLQRLDNPLVVPELAKFNFEINAPPLRFSEDVFGQMHRQLTSTWAACEKSAFDLDMRTVAVGILPTVRQQDFVAENMSALQRYKAMNQQVMRMRNGKPMQIDIQGYDHLQCQLEDVMLEAATTSFQMHLQLPPDKAMRIYNASKIVSAPLVAVTANSPWLFAKNLWAETRIPVFEQSVQVGHSHLTDRVTFGIRYVHESIMEVFASNLARFPILLPNVVDAPAEEMRHLSLHNGTIWRWNRPLIGFAENARPHLRLEQRCVPAGPTMRDSVANMAFYYGLVIALAEMQPAPELQLPFANAYENFYNCARDGLDAEVFWLDGEVINVAQLLEQKLIRLAEQGLDTLGVAADSIQYWLGIIHDRAVSRQNGACWQRRWCQKHGHDMARLVEAYRVRQQDDQPVHLWSLD